MKRSLLELEHFFLSSEPALRIEAVILFVRHEQKDKSVKPDPQGNAQIIKKAGVYCPGFC